VHTVPDRGDPGKRLAREITAAFADPIAGAAVDALMDAVARAEVPDPSDRLIVLLSAWVRDIRGDRLAL
jgi:hypothetical protein